MCIKYQHTDRNRKNLIQVIPFQVIPTTISITCYFRAELLEILVAIEKMGGAIQTDGDGESAEKRRDKIFEKMDKNEDQKLSMAEFIEGAKSDASIVKILQSS